MNSHIRNIALFTIGILMSMAFAVKLTTPVYFPIPKGWPKPHYDFSKNALTEEGFKLGRHLFYDPILSRDSTISCAGCHLQSSGFTHVDHSLSHGINGKIGTRNSMALMNLAWAKSFMWDGGVNHLDMQPLNPITNPAEMDETLVNVIRKLKRSDKYKSLFRNAFGDEDITGERLLKALSQFEVQLVSSNSKYDKVMRHEMTFTEQEQNGYNVFSANCASCHQEPLFNSERFETNGIAADTTLVESGRMRITNNAKDYLRFKVPTLRNVQFTFPYMHDGRFKTLTEVIQHYNAIPINQSLPSALSKPMNLSANDRVDLVIFLKTLSDFEFLRNPRFAFPQQNSTN